VVLANIGQGFDTYFNGASNGESLFDAVGDQFDQSCGAEFGQSFVTRASPSVPLPV